MFLKELVQSICEWERWKEFDWMPVQGFGWAAAGGCILEEFVSKLMRLEVCHTESERVRQETNTPELF